MQYNVIIAVSIFVGFGLSACGSTPAEGEQDVVVDAQQNDVGGDVNNSDTIDDITTGCDGNGPLCSYDCGGDFFESADCINDAWQCPEGTTDIDECPSGSCFGLPLPGEVCDDGFQCRPWDNGLLGDCPTDEQMLCADCRGFETTYLTQTCACTCANGNVSCEPLITACELESESSLPGVRLRFPEQACIFTLEQVAAGVPIPYELIVDDAITVTSVGLDAGGCGRSDYPLNVLPRIDGNGQLYCNCDRGLCDGVNEPFELEAGTYESSIEWTGRNWSGQSDTGNPLGEPFPAGAYMVTLQASGEYTTADGVAVDFSVEASLGIELID